MFLILLILLSSLLIMLPTVRCAVFHFPTVLINGCRDFIRYLSRRQRDLCPTGELVAYVGLFGRGKTLSAVHRVVGMYHRYNGKRVWCRRRKKFVVQRVQVLSNVALKIPYENLVSLEQIVLRAERNNDFDDAHDTLTITLVLGDEFSVQLNSRSFKTNIDPLFLNTLLTCRHYHISLYYTSQRFGHVDALLRQVTSYVVDCNKIWRFQRTSIYDAWDLENATNTLLLKPKSRSCWFVRDRDYDAYDTMACVGNLKKAMAAGDMMSEADILALQCNQQTNMEGISKPSRRWMAGRRKRNKK